MRDTPRDAATAVGVTALLRPGSGGYERLLRTAYLLSAGGATGEELLRQALARVVVARARQGASHAGVLAMLVRVYLSPWRRLADRRPPAGPRAPERGWDGDRTERWLARLPRRTRVVMVLRYYEGLSQREVAELLDCPPGLVEREQARGLARLGAGEPGMRGRDGATVGAAEGATPGGDALLLAAGLAVLAGQAHPGADGMARLAARLRAERRLWLLQRGVETALLFLVAALVVRVASWLCFACCRA